MFSRFTKGRSVPKDSNRQQDNMPADSLEASKIESHGVDEGVVRASAQQAASIVDAADNKLATASVQAADKAESAATEKVEPSHQSSSEPCFAVGIDLGTTHCVLAYMDLEQGQEVNTLSIPQLKDPGMISESDQLPSFIYLPHEQEFSAADLSLPWSESRLASSEAPVAVGEFARKQGSKTPVRLVSSAKSWLCHSGVDSKESFLPLDAPEELASISPFEATQYYLVHLKSAWKQQYPEHPLENQALTITVPASFDPAARELTVEAARLAGLGNAILLEEPQAALYGWLQAHEKNWRNHLQVGDVILVVDVGGGTTDLSLITVHEEQGDLSLQRIAVGEHILLGGDNMDLTLAYVVKGKLEKEGKKIEAWQLQGLTHGCRHAKEKLLQDESLEAVPIVVPSRGSSLMAGSLRTELRRDEVTTTLIEGFFPVVEASSKPVSRVRAALTKKGLPFAQDAGVSRHLADFLSRQREALPNNTSHGHSFLHPSVILFNGGVFKSQQLSQRLLENVNNWLSSEDAGSLKTLGGADLDCSVALGAAYYGHVRAGNGVRIRGGTSRSFYVGIESAMPAVPGFEPPVSAYCIAPFGMEEGVQAELPEEEFGLVVGEQASFRFFSSLTRQDDEVGTLLEDWPEGELEELNDISVNLPAEGKKSGEVVSVCLQAGVTEVGTLKLEAVSISDQQRWKVEFNVREDA